MKERRRENSIQNTNSRLKCQVLLLSYNEQDAIMMTSTRIATMKKTIIVVIVLFITFDKKEVMEQIKFSVYETLIKLSCCINSSLG
mmetsp:Transcript_8312/g.11865  ORF Transcript_8312/g.11865 Transcript_8312/m.11865 type:complete len:86 (-) Transcript_8312:1046-1303(-)